MSFYLDDKIYPWSILEDDGSNIIDNIYKKWEDLLSENNQEEVYHDFIANHAGFLLCDSFSRLIAISKLRLGADYAIDFAVARENYSRGLYWEIIEIETPATSPFIKRGSPSSRLTTAIQQIHDWKRWLIDNRREAERLFPANGLRAERKPNFKFTIIIGNRKNSEIWLHKRNQLSDELKIEIRSFDYLGDIFKNRVYRNHVYLGSAESKKLNDHQTNQLANPFFKAYTEKGWRLLLRDSKIGGSHFVPRAIEQILVYRQYNEDLLLQFKEILKNH